MGLNVLMIFFEFLLSALGKDQQRHLNLEIQREKRSYWHQIGKIFSWGSLASGLGICLYRVFYTREG
jgi:hypothetical protein